MANRKRSRKLSDGELRLMGILWERGSLTLAEVHQLHPGQLAYTTIQTQLNRLAKKRAVVRSRTRPMKYKPLIEPAEATDSLLQLLVATVGGGSIFPLVALLVSFANLTRDEIRKLKILIDQTSRSRNAPVKSSTKKR